MSVVDLHPEDLLDKDARGSLGEAERVRLDAHLAHCSACRLERQMRADFAAELDAELPLDRFVSLGALRNITADLGPTEPLAEPLADSRVMALPRRPRRRRAKLVWLLAAAALLVGGAAAAMNGLGEAPWTHLGLLPAPAAPPAAGTPEAPRPTMHRAPVVDVPEPTVTAAPLDDPHPVAAVRPAHPLVAASPAKVIGPAELFDTASEARRRGDYGRVLDVDRDLEAHYPTSREAQVLRVIVGRVLLDRGNPSGALSRFEGYLGLGGGDLTHEAMVGRATALDRLGRDDEAVHAWGALVTAFPDTPYAAHARARLENSTGR